MTKQIKLTLGLYTTVDDEWFEYLNQWKWHAHPSSENNKVYARRVDSRKGNVNMHRVIVGVHDPEIFVDHIDGDGLNNTNSNLRKCTRSQNMHNQNKHRNNTSGYKGVNWNKNSKKWEAKIRIKGKRIFIGLFDDKTDAALAYDEKAIEIHKDFSRTNLVGKQNAHNR